MNQTLSRNYNRPIVLHTTSPSAANESGIVPHCNGSILLDIPATTIAVESDILRQHGGPIVLDAIAPTKTVEPYIFPQKRPILLHFSTKLENR